MPTSETHEALVDACVKACADMDAVDSGVCTPSEQALYARLTFRLLETMQRAGLRQEQMHVVVDEFLAAARELAEDAEAAFAEHSRARFDAGLRDCPRCAEQEDEEEEEEDLGLVEIHLVCSACQRDLGTVAASILESIRMLSEPVKCPGCIREGR